MANPFLGQIIRFGGNFAPLGWAVCNGQLLPIDQNDALFQLLGTTYGGNGQTTFGLPDLRSRVPIGQGQGTGLSSYIIGQAGGVESVTLTANQLAAHTHPVGTVTPAGGTGTSTPSGTTVLGDEAGGDASQAFVYATNATSQQPLSASSITSSAVGGQPHSNIKPLLAVLYVIALNGIFPSQG